MASEFLDVHLGHPQSALNVRSYTNQLYSSQWFVLIYYSWIIVPRCLRGSLNEMRLCKQGLAYVFAISGNCIVIAIKVEAVNVWKVRFFCLA